jgi:hypothetical protein
MTQKRTQLNAMGIQSWVQSVQLPLQGRSEPEAVAAVAESEPVLCYQYRWEKDGKVVAILLAEYGSGSLPESNLVAAIAGALPWPSQGECKPIKAEELRLVKSPLVILGEGLAQQIGLQAGGSVWASHAPAALLADAKLKRHAWGKLQELKQAVL